MGRVRSFYVCQNHLKPPPRKSNIKQGGAFKEKVYSGKVAANKSDMILESYIKSLLEKYKDDPEIIFEINSCLSVYACNRTIALELGCKKSVAKLTKEFIDQLNQIDKREVI